MNKYHFYKLGKEWILDIPFKKCERRYVCGEITEECIRSIESGNLKVDNTVSESIIKHKECIFSFYKEFKRK